MSDLDYIRQLHSTLGQVPSDGSVPVHLEMHMVKRNLNREREFLMNHKVIGVVRYGHAFIYTFDTGQKYLSFVHPHKIQWSTGSF